WSPVRRCARRHAGLPRPAVRPPRPDPGLLRARVHAGQRRLRARGRTRQRGAAAPPGTGHRDARTRMSHPADHPGRRARLQSVPAHRRAGGPRRGGGAFPGRGRRPDRGFRRTASLEGRVPRVRARTAATALVLLAAIAGGPARAADHPAAPAPASPAPAETAPAPPAAGSGTVAGDETRARTPDDTSLDAPDPVPAAGLPPPATAALPPGTRSGVEIYQRFREGLAEPACPPDASSRWRAHFSDAPARLASPARDVLPLFGYVVDRLRASPLPTESALIPLRRRGLRPGARSAQGPAGLWQFIALTARNHKVPVQAGYDGRLSPVDSTEAAVRYLKTLHGMFAGDWRLAAMAYNAGEYRLLGALRRAGQRPAGADPHSLPMPAITHAYVRKLHALACLLEETGDR